MSVINWYSVGVAAQLMLDSINVHQSVLNSTEVLVRWYLPYIFALWDTNLAADWSFLNLTSLNGAASTVTSFSQNTCRTCWFCSFSHRWLSNTAVLLASAAWGEGSLKPSFCSTTARAVRNNWIAAGKDKYFNILVLSSRSATSSFLAL